MEEGGALGSMIANGSAVLRFLSRERRERLDRERWGKRNPLGRRQQRPRPGVSPEMRDAAPTSPPLLSVAPN